MVLIPFPFTDLRSRKLRPAVVLARSGVDDVILAFVTSRVPTDPGPVDHVLQPGDPEFGNCGLRAASVIRVDKLATLNRGLVARRLGRIGPATQAAIDRCLRHLFRL